MKAKIRKIYKGKNPVIFACIKDDVWFGVGYSPQIDVHHFRGAGV